MRRWFRVVDRDGLCLQSQASREGSIALAKNFAVRGSSGLQFFPLSRFALLGLVMSEGFRPAPLLTCLLPCSEATHGPNLLGPFTLTTLYYGAEAAPR